MTLLLLSLRRITVQCYFRSIAQFSTRSANWEPWEDKLLKNYISNNGNKWKDFVQHCLPHRTANGCQIRWSTVLNPALKHGPLTPHEVDLLRQGVTELGVGNWTKIAKQYLPDRSPYQLRSAWVSAYDPAIVKRPWTAQDDNLLLEGVKQHGVGHWTKIKETHLPHRAHQAIRNRYVDRLDPSLRQHPWTPDELDILLRRTILFGTKDWKKVAEGLDGRSPGNCRYTYLRRLDPSRMKRAYTENEIKLFWELTSIHAGRWKDISKYLGWTAEECRSLFASAQRKELKIFFTPEQVQQRSDESKPEWKQRIGELMCQHLRVHKPTIVGHPIPTPSKIHIHQDLNAQGQQSDEIIAKRGSSDKGSASNGGNYNERQPHSRGRKGKPKIEWTQEESDKLEQLMELHGRNWHTIAHHHGTKTAQQCQARYSSVLRYQKDGHYIHGKRLTKEEQDKIVQGVDIFGHDWIAISRTFLPSRKPEQCRRWYLRNMKHKTTADDDHDDNDDGYDDDDGDSDNDHDNDDIPNGEDVKSNDTITKENIWTGSAIYERSGIGRWSEEESERLRFAVNRYKDNLNWSDISRLVNTGRTPQQCSQHWKTTLQPSITKKGRWDWDEKLQLVELVQKYQMTEGRATGEASVGTLKESFWENVAKDLNTGRSAWSCRMKYVYMLRTNTLYR